MPRPIAVALFAATLAPALAACVAVDDPAELASTEQESSTNLAQTVDVECNRDVRDSETAPSLSHTFYDLDVGDQVWVGGTAYARYVHDPVQSYNKALVETVLRCAPGETIDEDLNDLGVVSRSGNNHWFINGTGHTNITHLTKGIYTAEVAGTHTCWLIMSCEGKNNGPMVEFSTSSSLTYYEPDQYPGMQWEQTSDYLVQGTGTHTPAGARTWYAGTSTQADSEVVVYWSPRLTNCVANDPQCPAVPHAVNADTHYKTRIAVYQYKDGVVCNKSTGPWSASTTCNWNDHHCDVKNYSYVTPIIQDPVKGTEPILCGGSTANRSFKVWTQIAKVNDLENDINVHGNYSSGKTNFFIYSR